MNHKYEPFLDESNSYFIAFEDFKEDASIRSAHIDFNDENFIAIGDAEYNEWEELELNKLSLLFESLYIELNKGMIYFYGCQFEVYCNAYPSRLHFFLDKNPDATEDDFCEYELKKNSIHYVSTDLLKDKMSYSIKKRNEFLKEKKVVSKSPITEPETIDYKNTISDFNLNEFNEVTYNLFIYLIDNYTKKGKVKFLNIYKYLKNINKDVYAFNFTQAKYKEFILEKYEVNLTTFSTANFEYDDTEKPILNGFEQIFRNHNLK